MITVGVSWDGTASPRVRAWRDEMERYGAIFGKQFNVRFEWVHVDAAGDPAAQASAVKDLIKRHVDAIVARPQDAVQIGASIEAARAAGIPFVTFDRASSVVQPDAHVGGDGCCQGLQAGLALADVLRKGDVTARLIELTGDPADPVARDKSDGFHRAEALRHAWTTIARVPTGAEPASFSSALASALAAHPDANAVFVTSDAPFAAVAKALADAGRLAPAGAPGHVWMATCDVQPAGYDAVIQGYIDVAATDETYAEADALVAVVADLLAGQKIRGSHLVPCRIATPANLATLPNVWSRDYRD